MASGDRWRHAGGVYRERPSSLPGAVVWTARHQGEGRVLPDGCMDLIWFGDHLVVAGPDTRAEVTARAGTFTGLRFAPGQAPPVLGLPAHALRDARVPLADLWDAATVRRWESGVGEAADPGRALEDLAAGPAAAHPPDPLVAEVARRVGRGDDVAAVAGAVGLSPRQLHRRSRDAFGYGPKVLGRILRLTRALDLARTGVPLAEVAWRAGYADQPHLARDARALAGTTVTALVGDPPPT